MDKAKAKDSFQLSRRDLIRAGAGATVGGLAACGPSERPRSSRSRALELGPLPDRFSRSEMMGRWARLRERMRERGFDCLIVPRAGNEADVRYLTGHSPNWIVFPVEGRVTCIFRLERSEEAVRSYLGDVDTRSQRLRRSSLVIDALKELGMERARIGVGSLTGVLRDDEGSASATALDRIRTALPRAGFESAAELLIRTKLQLGSEEVEVLKTVSRVSELGLEAMIDSARPGMTIRELWFEVFQTLLNATGEPPVRVALRAGEEANTSEGMPLDEEIEPGQVLGQEISGSLLGYGSQVNHSICVGSPVPEDWNSACQYCIDLYHSLVDWIQPGKSFTEFGEFYRRKVEERGPGYWGVVFHTGGLGDGPRMGPTRPDENLDFVIQENSVFTIKPRIPIRGVEAPAAQVGDPVLVTSAGVERLGRRELKVITV